MSSPGPGIMRDMKEILSSWTQANWSRKEYMQRREYWEAGWAIQEGEVKAGLGLMLAEAGEKQHIWESPKEEWIRQHITVECRGHRLGSALCLTAVWPRPWIVLSLCFPPLKLGHKYCPHQAGLLTSVSWHTAWGLSHRSECSEMFALLLIYPSLCPTPILWERVAFRGRWGRRGLNNDICFPGGAIKQMGNVQKGQLFRRGR